MIKNLMFDLGNVLAPFDWKHALVRIDPFLPERFSELLRKDEPAFRRLFFRRVRDLESGKISFEDFYATLRGMLEMDIRFDQFRDIWRDIFTPDLEMIEFGATISGHYATWLVSNTNNVHYEWLISEFPNLLFYRDAALSYELGAMKPDMSFYEKALNKFGVRAEESVFIDDLEENVQAAKRAGFNGVRFHGVCELKRELACLGVSIPGR
jgi:putative hydrolase of the HAD superfamily